MTPLTCLKNLGFFLLLMPLNIFAQGSGSGHISTLESILRQIRDKEAENVKLERRIQELNLLIPGEAAQIPPLDEEIDKLLEEKGAAYQELKGGYYCSECRRPKSQIERETNTSFEQHLRDVNGFRVPMGQDEIDKKMAEYDRKINDVKNKKKYLENSVNSKKKEAEDAASKIIQNKIDIPDLIQKARETANDYADKREAAYKSKYKSWISAIALPLGKMHIADCQKENLIKARQEFIQKSDELKRTKVDELNNKLNTKVELARDRMNTLKNEVADHKNERDRELRKIKDDIFQSESDSASLEDQFRNISNKTASDSFTYKSNKDQWKRTLADLRNKHKIRKDYWDKSTIPPKEKEIKVLDDSIWTITKERPFRVSALENKLDLIKNKGIESYDQAIQNAKNDYDEANQSLDAKKSSVTSELAAFNRATMYDKDRINTLMGQIGASSYKSVTVYTEYSVVSNMVENLEKVAEDTKQSGAIYTTYISSDVEEAMDVAAWSRNILNACNNTAKPSFQEQENTIIKDRIRRLEDKL